ncbi:hypothetical protein LCGC14_2699340 [marine sediment metagenome]|uniref:Uncharacterized protein n=1 Tax=marine sediment metagenome TaxID=412755 RepID=A0A0F9A3R8_9ZZZZ
MSTGQAFWAYKNETYLELCERYGEEPQESRGMRGCMFLESTGAHAKSLMDRYKEEKE